VSFVVCVALCAVFCLNMVCYCVYFCVVSYCSTTATGKTPFAVQLNNYNYFCKIS
jgi:hypothetical protein